MEIKILETIGVNSLKKQLSLLLATGAAAVGLYFAGYTYADASSTITVKAGDTVAKLATEYNDTVNGIKQRNNLADANLIVVGQQLKVGADNNTANTTTNYNYSTPPKTSTASYSYSAPQKTTTTNYSYVTPLKLRLVTQLRVILITALAVTMQLLVLTLVLTQLLALILLVLLVPMRLLKLGSPIKNLVALIQLPTVNTLGNINFPHHT